MIESPSLTANLLSSEQLNQLKYLLGSESLQLLLMSNGGNSKVFCVEAQEKKWAVKSYPPYAPNQRDRLLAESLTYQFLNQHQISAVPTFKTVCKTQRWLIIEWIDGIIPTTYTQNDIEQTLLFLQQIADLSLIPAASQLPHAAEACLSLNNLTQQITTRYKRLVEINDSSLRNFLQNDFLPLLQRYKKEAESQANHFCINSNHNLEQRFQSLIPADFGFHNSLRRTDGRLCFFDFDYFGWDDPVKLLADILWHPKMDLSTKQQQQFIQGISAIYQADPLFLTRFGYTVTLFGLRWVLILLNEFIPNFWHNRQHAQAHLNQEAAKIQQLEQAKHLLQKIQYFKL